MMKAYTRRSVERDVDKFVGWPKILDYYNGFEDPKFATTYSAAFLTGGRITEVLLLRPENFSFYDGLIEVKGMRNLKRYRKLVAHEDVLTDEEIEALTPSQKRRLVIRRNADGSSFTMRRWFETMVLEDFRQAFVFPEVEPMALDLKKYVIEHQSDEWLFASKIDPSRRIQRQYSYEIFKETFGGEIWQHWTRAQRASCLKSFYKWPDSKAMEWLGWVEPRNFSKYSKLGKEALGFSFDNVNYEI